MSLNTVWFNIPVLDINRAVEFYSWLLDIKIKINISNKMKYAKLTNSDGEEIGALFEERGFIPDKFGVLLYFYIKNELNHKVSKVVNLGGNIISKVMHPPEFSSCEIIEDSEGNRIALCYKDLNCLSCET
jgi:uncharacterized protein